MRPVALVLVLFAAASRIQAQAVAILHEPVACVVADRFPVVSARVEPLASVARARVVFRATGTAAWYFVEMQREKQAFRGTLPKPLKATQKIEYYIDAVDRSLGEVRTPEYAPAVVGGAGDCPSKMLTAAVLTSAKLAVGSLASGATALPAGFSGAGVVAGSVAGGTAAGAGAAGGASAGGGALKAVLIVAGAAAAAGGALVATGAVNVESRRRTWIIELVSSPPEPGDFLGGFNDRACNPSQSPQQSRTFGGRAGGSQFRTDDDGNFDFRLPQNTQDMLRLNGRVTETSFNATFTCLVGSGTTASLSATGSGGQFQGTFPLNGRTVSYTVLKDLGP